MTVEQVRAKFDVGAGVFTREEVETLLDLIDRLEAEQEDENGR